MMIPTVTSLIWLLAFKSSTEHPYLTYQAEMIPLAHGTRVLFRRFRPVALHVLLAWRSVCGAMVGIRRLIIQKRQVLLGFVANEC